MRYSKVPLSLVIMDNRKRTPGLTGLLDSSLVERRVREAGQLQEPEEDQRPGTGLSQGRRNASSFAAKLREKGGGRVWAKAVRVETSLLALVKERKGEELGKAEANEPCSQTCESLPSREEVLQSVMRKYKRKAGSADLRPIQSPAVTIQATPLPNLSQLSTATHTRTHSLSLSPGKALSPVTYQFANCRATPSKA